MATSDIPPKRFAVARAIWDARDPSISTTEQFWRYALAAIQAMEDPTEAMCEAATEFGDSEGCGHISESDAARIWRSMIMACLEE